MLAHLTGEICQNFMPVIQTHPELCSRQCLNDYTFCPNFIFFFCHSTSSLPGSLAFAGGRAAFAATNSFLLFHAALFALGNEPTFASNRAQYSALYDLLAKVFEQGVLGFSVA